ncbi:glycosyltransferase 87 family protein [Parenemella sanctibonifatiensis]|uniref:DUF2029 domain-containing protein n=1 Tax=Parenemella sanctibonifatiensis TaxID=2016505 RepID=A0A255EIN6_9ACTN|nr:glycosyltransferase 87 family protein [Parenemella sanctibonifatiensis]OYN90841.1 hypothetical protein CGZ91_04905 [Parenemella sanctibonifatiensis]
MSPETDRADRTASVVSHLARGFLIALAPLIVGFHVPIAHMTGTSLWPWRPNMEDLAVYREAAHRLLSGEFLYVTGVEFPYIYPPFAALLSVPLGAIPAVAASAVWVIVTVVSLLVVLHRLGLTGWKLSLAGTLTILFTTPFQQVLVLGQLGVVIMAAIVVELVPGPRLLDKIRLPRLLPTGAWTGVMTGIKLTPGLFLVALAWAGRWRIAITGAVATLATMVIGFIAAPRSSWHYWSQLTRGDSGSNPDANGWLFNQSILSLVHRMFGFGTAALAGGLLVCLLVAVWTAWLGRGLWQRGEQLMAIVVLGLGSTLVNPIAWNHHLVWFVPLAVALLRPGTWPVLRWVGLAWCGWAAFTPWSALPQTPGAFIEVGYSAFQLLVSGLTAILGVVVLVLAADGLRRPVSPSADGGDSPDSSRQHPTDQATDVPVVS